MNYNTAISLLNKTVHFTATCELFPHNGICGRVIDVTYAKNGEVILTVMVSHRRVTIGGNTRGLAFSTISPDMV